LPGVEPFLYGIKPAVIAVILGAIWRLAKPAVKSWRHALLGLAVAVALLAGVGEIPALVAGGIVGMGWFRSSGGGGASSAPPGPSADDAGEGSHEQPRGRAATLPLPLAAQSSEIGRASCRESEQTSAAARAADD